LEKSLRGSRKGGGGEKRFFVTDEKAVFRKAKKKKEIESTGGAGGKDAFRGVRGIAKGRVRSVAEAASRHGGEKLTRLVLGGA